MGREPRVWFPGAVFHITARGNRKNNIFRDSKDYHHYLSLLLKAKLRTPFILHSFCLMPNHIHLVIETINHSPTEIIHYIHSIYARYFNRKYNYIGHVFQGRYYSKMIKNMKQLLDTCSYIHLNPVKSRSSKLPEDYRWSNYKSYVNMVNDKITDKEKIYQALGDNPQQKYQFYVESKLRVKDWERPT
ncbi:transposase [Bacillus sp. Marseille-Q1617]|uniref:transposase n=1 Tax=Bacillus sp. Marseille-Q1617 TaxID=2736887 RepID=UPI00158C48CB